MPRVIKFRAWDTRNSVMDYAHADSPVWEAIASVLGGTNTRWTPMLATGLLDKNGRDIYEGDILLHATSKGAPMHSIVAWDETNGMFVGLDAEDTERQILLAELLEEADPPVIGNIYENGDLLNG